MDMDIFYALSDFFDRSIISFTYEELPYVLFVALTLSLLMGYAVTFSVIALLNALAERFNTPAAVYRAVSRVCHKARYTGSRREAGRRHAAA